MKFAKVDTQEKFDGWKAFAATFDHASDSPTMPLTTIANDTGQLIGHYSELREPVIFPAFHPTISKREFRTAVELISNHYIMSSMGPRYPNGVIFVALPKELPVDHSRKMGFEKLDVDLYRRVP